MKANFGNKSGARQEALTSPHRAALAARGEARRLLIKEGLWTSHYRKLAKGFATKLILTGGEMFNETNRQDFSCGRSVVAQWR